MSLTSGILSGWDQQSINLDSLKCFLQCWDIFVRTETSKNCCDVNAKIRLPNTLSWVEDSIRDEGWRATSLLEIGAKLLDMYTVKFSTFSL